MRCRVAEGMWGIAAVIAGLLGTSACSPPTGAEDLTFGGQGGGGAGSESTSSAPPEGGESGNPEAAGGAGAMGSGDPEAGGGGSSATTSGGGDGGPSCGDATCQAGETCEKCPEDCGECESCGNGACDAGEGCESCPGDCGQCDPCGNGTCDAGETCATCAGDCGACSTCKGSGDATTPLDSEEAAFLVIINQYRAGKGLGSLAACTSLNRAAQGHSEDMRDQGYFAHAGLDGSSPWSRSCDACYELGCGPDTTMAENIAAGKADAQTTFTQWKGSPTHNVNMLGQSFTMIGIGRATGGGQYGVYWTTVFGGDTEASCN